MKNRILHTIGLSVALICLIFISGKVLAQQDKLSERLRKALAVKTEGQMVTVWIFFTDKGPEDESQKKISTIMLPGNASKRRSKIFGNNDQLATWFDIPLLRTYVSEIEGYLENKRRESKWLNALSADVRQENLPIIAAFGFVKRIDLLAKGKLSQNQYQPNFSPLLSAGISDVKDLNYGDSYNQNQQIRVPELHNMGFAGQGIVICMMDAGYNNLSHISLQDLNILGTWDFVNNNVNVGDEDDFGTGEHGTLTLSALGGYHPGALIGPAYAASFVLTKTENTESETQVEEDNWIAALEWAEDNFGPDITSTSLGYINFDNGFAYSAEDLDGNTTAITIASDIAAYLGILVVNSAGNSGPGSTTLGAPADGDSVLAVGAVTPWGEIAGFSSRGPTGDGRIKPEVSAQGVQVVSASPYDDSYVYPNGTSLSCPLVAGAAALLLQAFPNATNMQVYEALKITASQSYEPDNDYGWGIVNTWAAYNYLSGKPHIVHRPVENAYDTQDFYTISAEVRCVSNSLPEIVNLTYKVNDGEWENIPMTVSVNNHYSADIPGVYDEATIYYYLYSENSNGAIHLPENAPDSAFSFPVFRTGIDHENLAESIFVVPNPARNHISVYSVNSDVLESVDILNVMGQTYCSYPDLISGSAVSVAGLPAGTWFLKVKSKGRLAVLKFVKLD